MNTIAAKLQVVQHVHLQRTSDVQEGAYQIIWNVISDHSLYQPKCQLVPTQD